MPCLNFFLSPSSSSSYKKKKQNPKAIWSSTYFYESVRLFSCTAWSFFVFMAFNWDVREESFCNFFDFEVFIWHFKYFFCEKEEKQLENLMEFLIKVLIFFDFFHFFACFITIHVSSKFPAKNFHPRKASFDTKKFTNSL